MNVDSVLLSDFGQVDRGGKLTVVGVFNTIQGPGPEWVVPFLTISLVIQGHVDEGGEHHGEIRLVNRRREVVNPKPIDFEFQLNPEEARVAPGMPLRAVKTYTIMGMKLEEPGPYAFEIFLDGTFHAAANLYVRQVPKG